MRSARRCSPRAKKTARWTCSEALFAKSEENGSLDVLQAIQTNLNCEKYFNRLLKGLV